MQFNIPSIGDKIELTKPWTFDVWSEHRNESLGKVIGLYKSVPCKYYGDGHEINLWEGHEIPHDRESHYARLTCIKSGECTLPKGTVLTVDRIYIRKGAEGFDSISFWINKSNDPRFKGKRIRFWVKLDNANKIQYKQYQDE